MSDVLYAHAYDVRRLSNFEIDKIEDIYENVYIEPERTIMVIVNESAESVENMPKVTKYLGSFPIVDPDTEVYEVVSIFFERDLEE